MSEELEKGPEDVHNIGNVEEEIDLDALQAKLEGMEEGPEKEALAEKIRTHLGEIN